jgi:hypothetical protein
MKRSENNIGETDHRSVKVHHAPGGASNFSLAWGDQPQPTANNQVKSRLSIIQKTKKTNPILFSEKQRNLLKRLNNNNPQRPKMCRNKPIKSQHLRLQ